MLRRSVAALLLFAIIGGLAFARIARADDAHHPDATPTTADACSVPPSETPTTGMGSPMAGMNVSQEFDLMFIDMMIPHHEGAIAMAKVALERGEHQEVRDLAKTIVTTQQAEIDQMTAWRDAWYPGAPAMPMDQMAQMMAGMMSGMPGMMGTPGAGMPDMGGMMGMMDPQAEVQALCDAAGAFDEVFLRMMVPHHQSAVVMAEVALLRATRPEVKQLAQSIIDAQQREIAQMQDWLAAWSGAGPAATPTGSPVATEVEVTLSEFAVASTFTEFRVGQPYRFVVTNEGAIPHEFMILPWMEGIGQKDMETLDAAALVMIHEHDLPPGVTRTVEVTFSQPVSVGDLELVCAVPGHYDAGMTLPITVVA
jgi:uncharacterized protein (DUF305 family)/uncharacterized cupredoxin-like copper-binding protein